MGFVAGAAAGAGAGVASGRSRCSGRGCRGRQGRRPRCRGRGRCRRRGRERVLLGLLRRSGVGPGRCRRRGIRAVYDLSARVPGPKEICDCAEPYQGEKADALDRSLVQAALGRRRPTEAPFGASLGFPSDASDFDPLTVSAGAMRSVSIKPSPREAKLGWRKSPRATCSPRGARTKPVGRAAGCADRAALSSSLSDNLDRPSCQFAGVEVHHHATDGRMVIPTATRRHVGRTLMHTWRASVSCAYRSLTSGGRRNAVSKTH